VHLRVLWKGVCQDKVPEQAFAAARWRPEPQVRDVRQVILLTTRAQNPPAKTHKRVTLPVQ